MIHHARPKVSRVAKYYLGFWPPTTQNCACDNSVEITIGNDSSDI
jgi:hypothetical protein